MVISYPSLELLLFHKNILCLFIQTSHGRMSYERTEGKNHWNSLNTGLNLTHNLQNFSIWDWNVSLSLFWLNKTYIFFPSDNIVSYCNSHGYLILMLNRVRIYGRFSRGSLFQLITWHKLTATYILFLRFLLTFLFLIILSG